MQSNYRRYDIYALIHKGLRAYLSHVLLEVGRTDWRDTANRTASIAAVRELLTVFRIHLTQEDRVIHPAMEARQPGSTRQAATDHMAHLHAIEQLQDVASTVDSANNYNLESAGEWLYRELAMFVSDNLEHMAVEESINNRVLWETHSDDEIIAMERAIVTATPPEHMLPMLRWTMPNLAPDERALMLGEMLRYGAPAEVFDGVLAMMRALLPPKDWSKLTVALSTN
ncbi:hemerythrin domain-containing protein [Chitinimonas arctica]|nr:hemerythrin domain-containing protein [Chitinimonas arctica]